MNKKDTPFGLRLPGELKGWLAEQARANLRSLHGEIVFRLQSSREQQEAHAKTPA